MKKDTVWILGTASKVKDLQEWLKTKRDAIIGQAEKLGRNGKAMVAAAGIMGMLLASCPNPSGGSGGPNGPTPPTPPTHEEQVAEMKQAVLDYIDVCVASHDWHFTDVESGLTNGDVYVGYDDGGGAQGKAFAVHAEHMNCLLNFVNDSPLFNGQGVALQGNTFHVRTGTESGKLVAIETYGFAGATERTAGVYIGGGKNSFDPLPNSAWRIVTPSQDGAPGPSIVGEYVKDTNPPYNFIKPDKDDDNVKKLGVLGFEVGPYPVAHPSRPNEYFRCSNFAFATTKIKGQQMEIE